MRDPIADLKHELLVAADRQHKQRAGVGDSRRRLHVSLRRNRVVLTAATVAVAATAALLFATPWTSTPGSPRLGFLEEVQAALTPPAGAAVLHVKVVMTQIGAECKDKVTFPPSEYWQDLAPPYNFRAFEVQQDAICAAGYLNEIGGEWGSGKPNLRFLPPNTLTTSHIQYDPDIGPDPTADLRQAIEDGFAHREGRTVLDDGRTVERIRQDCDLVKFPLCPDPQYWYVDPETFKPVRQLAGPGIRPGPGATCSAPCGIADYVEYEYLAGTPANRALADIRAQHPGAIER